MEQCYQFPSLGREVILIRARRTGSLHEPQTRRALQIGAARRLTLAGHDATFVAHPSNGVLSVFDSRDVTIRDPSLTTPRCLSRRLG